MIEPTHDFLRKAVGFFLLKGGRITHLPDQKVRKGLTALPKPSDKANEETDAVDWLSDSLNSSNE